MMKQKGRLLNIIRENSRIIRLCSIFNIGLIKVSYPRILVLEKGQGEKEHSLIQL